MGICRVLDENRHDLNSLIGGIVDPSDQPMKRDLRLSKADFEGRWSGLRRWDGLISHEAALQNADKQQSNQQSSMRHG